MEKFRRGDTLYVKLVVRNKVGIKDVYIVFVHEEDDNAHIFWGVQGREGEDKPLPPSDRTILTWEKTIDEDQKLGVYTLDKVNFKAFDGAMLDAPFPVGKMKFEVVEDLEDDIPDLEDDPVVMEEVDAPIVIEELAIAGRLSGS